jgi:hypothetical protein
LSAYLFQGRACGEHLGDDVRAATLAVDHTLQSAYLALYPLEPVEQLFVGGRYCVFYSGPPGLTGATHGRQSVAWKCIAPKWGLTKSGKCDILFSRYPYPLGV